ncbi:hypothetical protein J6590_070569 [Homalodisca vitripennis]|nr:hypothetical protein J6590_070569 [Homalodisca vitripennis]
MDNRTVVVLRFVLVIIGAVPGNWQEPWKRVVFRLYAYILDTQYFFIAVTKVMYSVHTVDFTLNHLVDNWESMILVSLTLERLLIRWKSDKIVHLFSKIEKFPKPGVHVTDLGLIYQKQSRNIMKLFSFLTLTTLFDLSLKYLRNACTGNETKGDQRLCMNFLMDILVPSELLTGPWYRLLFALNSIMTVMFCFLGIVSFLMVPILAILISCQFRIVADTFEKRLKVGVYKLCSDESCPNGEQNLVNVIKQHQYTLEVASMMGQTFHFIVLLKLVFLSLPLIIGAYSMSQVNMG